MNGSSRSTEIYCDAGEIYVEPGHTSNGYMTIDDTTIKIPVANPTDAAVIDARGCVVLPGFVDQHLHGVDDARFWGLLTVDDYASSVIRAAELLPRYGVTAFVPTSITDSEGGLKLLAAVDRVAKTPRRPTSARLLGSHAEGPFLNPLYRGAHDEHGLKEVTREEVRRLFEAAGESLLIVTLAASLPGSVQAIQSFGERNVVCQLGHDMPGWSDFNEAIRSGAKGVTHLFNGMGGLNHRNDDLPAMTLHNVDLTFELIVAGGFVSKSWLRHALDIGLRRAIAVSDSVGTLPLEVNFNGTELVASHSCHVRKSDNAIWATTGSLMDSVVSLRELGMGWQAVARFTSLNSVSLLNRHSNTVTRRAGDIVIWRDGFGVVCTLIDGTVAYDSNAGNTA